MSMCVYLRGAPLHMPCCNGQLGLMIDGKGLGCAYVVEYFILFFLFFRCIGSLRELFGELSLRQRAFWVIRAVEQCGYMQQKGWLRVICLVDERGIFSEREWE